jgi:hypothetical protein
LSLAASIQNVTNTQGTERPISQAQDAVRRCLIWAIFSTATEVRTALPYLSLPTSQYIRENITKKRNNKEIDEFQRFTSE